MPDIFKQAEIESRAAARKSAEQNDAQLKIVNGAIDGLLPLLDSHRHELHRYGFKYAVMMRTIGIKHILLKRKNYIWQIVGGDDGQVRFTSGGSLGKTPQEAMESVARYLVNDCLPDCSSCADSFRTHEPTAPYWFQYR